jgi:hypothetical protein
MEWLWKVDWAGIYEPKHALLDVFLRGSALYLLIFVLLRLVVRRQIGGIGKGFPKNVCRGHWWIPRASPRPRAGPVRGWRLGGRRRSS